MVLMLSGGSKLIFLCVQALSQQGGSIQTMDSVAPYLYRVQPPDHLCIHVHFGTANGGTGWRFVAINTFTFHFPKDSKSSVVFEAMKARNATNHSPELPINCRLDLNKTFEENDLRNNDTIRWWLRSSAPSDEWLNTKPITIPDPHSAR